MSRDEELTRTELQNKDNLCIIYKMRLNSTLQAVLIFSLHILFNCYVNANGSIVRTKRARALDIRRSHSSPRARPSRRRARPRYVDGVKPTPTPILTPRRPIIGTFKGIHMTIIS